MTIHLPSTLSPEVLNRLLGYLRRQKIAFQVVEAQREDTTLPSKEDILYEVARTGRNPNWSDDPETRTIQMRLHEKYVLSGEWDKMDDDERQDASLLEKMLYRDSLVDNETLTELETEAFINELKLGTYGRTG